MASPLKGINITAPAETGNNFSSRGESVRPAPRQQYPERLHQDLDVQPQAPLVDVLDIQADHLVEIPDLVPSAHLPQAGDSRLDADPLAVLVLVPGDLLRRRRARPHQAHLPSQHVPELGQLVQAHPAEKLADPCDARIVPHLEEGPVHLVQRDQLLLLPFRILDTWNGISST